MAAEHVGTLRRFSPKVRTCWRGYLAGRWWPTKWRGEPGRGAGGSPCSPWSRCIRDVSFTRLDRLVCGLERSGGPRTGRADALGACATTPAAGPVSAVCTPARWRARSCKSWPGRGKGRAPRARAAEPRMRRRPGRALRRAGVSGSSVLPRAPARGSTTAGWICSGRVRPSPCAPGSRPKGGATRPPRPRCIPWTGHTTCIMEHVPDLAGACGSACSGPRRPAVAAGGDAAGRRGEPFLGSLAPAAGRLPPLRRDEVHVHLAWRLSLPGGGAATGGDALRPRARPGRPVPRRRRPRRRYVAGGACSAPCWALPRRRPGAGRVPPRLPGQARPMCAATHGDGLCFSASHSHERALFAIRRGGRSGRTSSAWARTCRWKTSRDVSSRRARTPTCGRSLRRCAPPDAGILDLPRGLRQGPRREAALALGRWEVAFAAGGAAALRAKATIPGAGSCGGSTRRPGTSAALAVRDRGWRAGFACRGGCHGAFGGIIAVASCR